MRPLIRLLLLFVLLVTSSCRWHLQNMTTISPKIKKIIFIADDPNSPFNRTIRKHFHFNNIEIVEKKSLNQAVPSFFLIDSLLKSNTSLASQDGKVIRQKIMLSVNAKIFFPSKNTYQISTKVYRSFLVNSQNALANNAEKEVLINEIYDSAAEQLVHKLSRIQLASEKSDTTRSTLSCLHNFTTSYQ